MKIKALYYYPVKSLAGIAVDELALDPFGPAADRRWMLVDANGSFITQRKYPRLALIHPSFDADGLSLEIPGQGRVAVVPGTRTRMVTVWKDEVEGTIAAGDVAQALSAFLDTKVELVHMAATVVRPARHETLSRTHPVSFADGFPFLVTHQASLDDLNRRLPWHAQMGRFRPNVVVEGGLPWDEDRWQQISLGEVVVDLVKPCSRCIVTTVDPDSGERSRDGEPLKTLAGFRRAPGGVMFGVNGVHHDLGSLRVGDPVSVIKWME